MMKTIPLTQGRVAMVDDADYDWLSQFKWFYNSGYAGRNFSLAGGRRRQISMHRLIANTPSGLETDHKDGDGLNNQRDNLRICTHAENLCNRGADKDGTSGYKGVSWDNRSRKWRAYICFDNRFCHLGLFPTALEAALAYDEAVLRYHGSFARPNVQVTR